jgi:hypothetical protein
VAELWDRLPLSLSRYDIVVENPYERRVVSPVALDGAQLTAVA